MKNYRLVSTLPLPRYLPLHGLLTKVGRTSYGVQILENLTTRELQDLLTHCRTAMAAGESVGLCPADIRIRALFFDMDSTVIAEESIVAIAATVGCGEEVHKITERAMAGELDFKSALAARVKLLRGLEVARLDDIGRSLTLNKGIQAVAAFCRLIKVPVFLVSGGFHPLADEVARRVGFTAILANRFEVIGERLTGELSGPIVDAEMKRKFLIDTCKQLNISTGTVAAIGDGANDLLMLDEAGVAVGYKPKSVLIDHIDGALQNGDHQMLIPLLFGRDPGTIR